MHHMKDRAVGDPRSTVVIPANLENALIRMAEEDLLPFAGGTDIYPSRVGRVGHRTAIDIGMLDDLRGIEIGDETRIGALTTWTEIVKADLPLGLRALQQAAREVGSVQIQNLATVAGNLVNASPAADGVPPLLAADARVELRSVGGTRELALADFITGYRATARRSDELVTAVIVPATSHQRTSSFMKLGSRRYLVISIASVAAVVAPPSDGRLSEVAIAVGSCSPVARRQPALEAALVGQPLERMTEVIGDATLDLDPIDDVRASAAYRLDAVRVLVRRAIDDSLHSTAEVPA